MLTADAISGQVLVEEGKVKYVGLADCTADQLRRAHAVHPVSAIEVEWSLCARHNEVGLSGLPLAVVVSPDARSHGLADCRAWSWILSSATLHHAGGCWANCGTERKSSST